jgi:phosphoribosylanthranilate isomerase
VKIKFCGLRRAEDVDYVNQCLPDYAGFVFAPSRRRVTAEEAASLCRNLDPGIKTVGVFVNERVERIVETVITARLEVVQLHGDESVEEIMALRHLLPTQEIWKAVRTTDREALLAAGRLPVDKLLIDAFTPGLAGGTGVLADWYMVRQVREALDLPFFLAGGLNLNNVVEAIETVQPFGIDLSSGIETSGVKDFDKMMRFVQKVRRNDQ